ncbi:MAG: TylF/MycF/NovP-related O-methyltransferase [Myxococcota bacterium]
MTELPRTEALYLDLMKKCLTRSIFPERWRPYRPKPKRRLRGALVAALQRVLAHEDLELVRRARVDPAARASGAYRHPDCETMLGLQRLGNLERCVIDVLRWKVPGDLIETGVWRGGAVIFMRAILAAYGASDRTVWVADSFRGLPPPDPAKYPADLGDLHYTKQQLAIPIEEVKRNFERYGLLDDQVRFLAGWFSDTLPTAPIDRLAIVRLDGDMYSSTIDALRPLYPRLSPGGYLIVDDFGLAGCRAAVEDYRREHGISEKIIAIDSSAAYWQKSPS